MIYYFVQEGVQISPWYIILFCTGEGFLQIFFARSFVDVLTFKNIENRHVYCLLYGMGKKKLLCGYLYLLSLELITIMV